MARYKYKNDYKSVTTPDGGTEYVYVGEYYENRVGRKQAVLCAACSLLITLLYLAAGMQNGECGRTVYVLLPYAGAALPLIYLFAGCIRLLRNRSNLTRNQYETGLPRVKRSLVAAAALLCAALIGAVFLIIQNRNTQDIIFAILCLCAALLCILLRIMTARHPKL